MKDKDISYDEYAKLMRDYIEKYVWEDFLLWCESKGYSKEEVEDVDLALDEYYMENLE